MEIDEAIIVNVVAVPAFPKKMDDLVRVPLQKQEKKLHMIVTINEDEGDDIIVPEEKSVEDNPECVLCEFIMTKLEAELKDKKTEVRFSYFFLALNSKRYFSKISRTKSNNLCTTFATKCQDQFQSSATNSSINMQTLLFL